MHGKDGGKKNPVVSNQIFSSFFSIRDFHLGFPHTKIGEGSIPAAGTEVEKNPLLTRGRGNSSQGIWVKNSFSFRNKLFSLLSRIRLTLVSTVTAVQFVVLSAREKKEEKSRKNFPYLFFLSEIFLE